MSDLRAERRAYVVQLLTSFCHGGMAESDIPKAYKDADAIIQHDLDNPPERENRRLDVEFKSVMQDLTERQEPLGADFEKVWDDNVNKLYEVDAPSGWVRASERLPTEEDAPREQVWVADDDDGAVYLKDAALATLWDRWHPATGQFKIPEPPAPLEPPK
jgi:hypothetical protein